jgi:hypothetical protein
VLCRIACDLIIRGIDGASIDLGTWKQLSSDYAHLSITLAFTVVPNFVQGRLPAAQDYFTRAVPNDNRMYGFLALPVLAAHLVRTRHDPMSAFLKGEWLLGRQYRQELSAAWSSRDAARRNAAMGRFLTLRTTLRNKIPWFGQGVVDRGMIDDF